MAPKNSPEMFALLIRERRKGSTINACAAVAGITPQTVHGWLGLGREGRSPYAEFSRLFEEAFEAAQGERDARLRALVA